MEVTNMDREIWKWILDSFSDEEIAKLSSKFNLKIPGFRLINHLQNNFKIIRPKIIQSAMNKKYAEKLNNYVITRAKVQLDVKVDSLRKKSIKSLLQLTEEGIKPSILLGILLASGNEKELAKAEVIYSKLKTENKLFKFEKQAGEDDTNTEVKVIQDQDSLKTQQEEFKLAQQSIEKLDKRLKKLDQKNEELKSKETSLQTSLQTERKRSKELSQEVNSLKGEIGSLKHKLKTASPDTTSLQKKLDNQAATLKTKVEEISRLNALVLKLNTELDKLSSKKNKTVETTPELLDKIKVALIGDPKNKGLEKNVKFELNIFKGPEVTPKGLDGHDQIWLLNYKIPRSVQKRVKSCNSGKPIFEFTTFTELEHHMLKGLV
jgi:DNA repair exonuclease SbcCD ATPase subunit